MIHIREWDLHVSHPMRVVFPDQDHSCEQAQKAMYGATRKIRKYNSSVESQLDLFDKVVAPVVLYCSEIWGF